MVMIFVEIDDDCNSAWHDRNHWRMAAFKIEHLGWSNLETLNRQHNIDSKPLTAESEEEGLLWKHWNHESSEQRILHWTSNTRVLAKTSPTLNVFLQKWFSGDMWTVEACSACLPWKTTMTAFVMIHPYDSPSTEYQYCLASFFLMKIKIFVQGNLSSASVHPASTSTEQNHTLKIGSIFFGGKNKEAHVRLSNNCSNENWSTAFRWT